jgi:hypothetical protein
LTTNYQTFNEDFDLQRLHFPQDWNVVEKQKTFLFRFCSDCTHYYSIASYYCSSPLIVMVSRRLELELEKQQQSAEQPTLEGQKYFFLVSYLCYKTWEKEIFLWFLFIFSLQLETIYKQLTSLELRRSLRLFYNKKYCEDGSYEKIRFMEIINFINKNQFNGNKLY